MARAESPLHAAPSTRGNGARDFRSKLNCAHVLFPLKLIPGDRRFIKIDEHLLGFEIFFQTPGSQLAAESRLFVATPGSFHVSGLHVIDPNNSGADGFHHTKSFVNIACPNRGSQPVRSIVGDADRSGFIIKRNYRSHRTKNFFAGNSRIVVDIVKNGGLDVVTFSKLLWPAATDGYLGFFLADLKIRADAIVLLFADQRAHFCGTVEWRAEMDAFRFFGHGFDKFGINFLFYQDAAACGADFTLINEHAE